MTVGVIIPARYDSTRFPGKPLYPLKGKPIIQYVYENASRAQKADDVIVATDSEAIRDAVITFGGNAVMTDKGHPSGTDRIAEIAGNSDYDIIVNVQADEPLIRPEMIDDSISLLDDKRASLGTLMKKIKDPGEIADPNVVKVVVDTEGFALYFSRAPIPFRRDEWQMAAPAYPQGNPSGTHTMQPAFQFFCPSLGAESFYKHVGLYSYRRDSLLSLSRMAPSRVERIEKLEQLRALEHGMKIKVLETFFETYGVDIPEDVERVEQCLNISS